MGGEERGELVVWLVKFAWIRACVKARLPDDPDHLDQRTCNPKQERPIMAIVVCMYFRSWKIVCQHSVIDVN